MQTIILLTGAGGVLGYYFCKMVPQEYVVCGTYFKNKLTSERKNITYLKLDITKIKQCAEIIKKVKPDIIIHAAGMGDIDACEKDKRTAYKANFLGTKNLVDCIKNTKIKMIFISSSNVFSGRKKYYTENSVRRPTNYYGYTKKISEDYIRTACKNYLITRLPTMYGWNRGVGRDNIATNLLSQYKKNEVLVVVDRYTNFVYARTVAKSILRLINSRLNKTVIHLGGETNMSYYDFALSLKGVFNKIKYNLIAVRSDDLNYFAKRPKLLFLKSIITSEYDVHRSEDVKSGLKSMYKDKLKC